MRRAHARHDGPGCHPAGVGGTPTRTAGVDEPEARTRRLCGGSSSNRRRVRRLRVERGLLRAADLRLRLVRLADLLAGPALETGAAGRAPCSRRGGPSPRRHHTAMADEAPDRRRFLRALGGTVVVAGAGPLAGCPWNHTPAHGALEAGNQSGVAVGTLVPVGDQPVLLGRDARGLYAMSTVCAHKGCDIRSHGEITSQGLHCSCHGSRYDANGIPTHGPAERPLQHYAVTVGEDGRIVIDADTVVAAESRTPFPPTN